MFELPGLNPQDDVKKDLDALRRYLMKFVPQLEQELANLGTDNFTSAYNERLEGLTSVQAAGKSVSTPEAIANHLLDHDNPHRVTAAQVGLGETIHGGDGYACVDFNGWRYTLLWITHDAGETETQAGALYYDDISLGDWPVEMGEIFYTTAELVSGESGTVFRGARWGISEESAGTVRVYRPEATDEGYEIFVLGVSKYGN